MFHSSLKKIGLSKSDTFTDPIIEEGLTERYYWIRYAVNRPQQRIGGIAPTEVFSTFEPASATGAAVGSAAGAVDGISISMSNDNATVVADEAGTVSSFANTGTAIKVFITGGSPITYDNASPYQNNSFVLQCDSDKTEFPFKILNGNPGYINYLDAFNSWLLVKEAQNVLKYVVATSFKHNTPAGVGSLTSFGKDIYDEDKTPSAQPQTPSGFDDNNDVDFDMDKFVQFAQGNKKYFSYLG